MNKLVITRRSDLVLVIEYCDGEPVRIFPAKNETVTLGSIYVGRVSKVKKELDAVFVDFLPGITGFLPVEQNCNIKEGQSILVRVIKEPIKTKGYTLSEVLEISGDFCVLSNKGPDIHCSSKINKDFSTELKIRLEKDLPKEHFGGIIRTASANADYKSLYDEYTALNRILSDIVEYGPSRSLYSCLYKERPTYLKVLSDLRDDSIEEIVTDDKEIYEDILKMSDSKVVFHSNEDISLEAKYRVKHAIALATEKQVYLNCGGYLVIEPTEALTVIDVNSGKFDLKKDRDAMIKKVNFEAAEMVTKQLMLRNISGMIVVDFINFSNSSDEKELIQYMKTLLRKDNCKCKVYGFTALKFMEIARQKIRASIYDYNI